MESVEMDRRKIALAQAIAALAAKPDLVAPKGNGTVAGEQVVLMAREFKKFLFEDK